MELAFCILLNLYRLKKELDVILSLRAGITIKKNPGHTGPGFIMKILAMD